MTTTASFANGGEIPVIGFGTWQITGQTCVDAVRTALRSDYRHIDTATMYGNEAEVGAAWQDSGLPRDDLFLTTKLPPRLAGQARRTLEKSLRSLGTDHVDPSCDPAARRPDRIAANIDVDGFTLTADEMAAIDALGS